MLKGSRLCVNQSNSCKFWDNLPVWTISKIRAFMWTAVFIDILQAHLLIICLSAGQVWSVPSSFWVLSYVWMDLWVRPRPHIPPKPTREAGHSLSDNRHTFLAGWTEGMNWRRLPIPIHSAQLWGGHANHWTTELHVSVCVCLNTIV